MTNTNSVAQVVTQTEQSILTILNLLESKKINEQHAASMLNLIDTKTLQSETGLKGSKSKIIKTILKDLQPTQKTDTKEVVKISHAQMKKDAKDAIKDAFNSEIYSLTKLVERLHDKTSKVNKPILDLCNLINLPINAITSKRLLNTWAAIDAAKVERYKQRMEQYKIDLNAFNHVAKLCSEQNTKLSIEAPKQPNKPTFILTLKDDSKRPYFSLNHVLQGVEYLAKNSK